VQNTAKTTPKTRGGVRGKLTAGAVSFGKMGEKPAESY